MNIADFAGREPLFRFEEFFLGPTRAWGIFEDRFGNLRREMVIDMNGWWDDAVFVLDEDFDFADGERMRRRWRATPLPNGRYIALSDDIVGEALGEAAGNALRWRYRLPLMVGGRKWLTDFDDWMFLQRDGVAVNRATARWKGLRIGSVSMFVRRVGG